MRRSPGFITTSDRVGSFESLRGYTTGKWQCSPLLRKAGRLGAEAIVLYVTPSVRAKLFGVWETCMRVRLAGTDSECDSISFQTTVFEFSRAGLSESPPSRRLVTCKAPISELCTFVTAHYSSKRNALFYRSLEVGWCICSDTKYVENSSFRPPTLQV